VNPWRDWKQLSKREGKELYRVQCCERLKNIMPPDAVLYSLSESTRTGANRFIRLYVVSKEGNIVQVTKLVAFGFGYRLRERQGREYIATGSTASDLCNHVAYELGIGETYHHEHL
jgi:hypothetical protein